MPLYVRSLVQLVNKNLPEHTYNNLYTVILEQMLRALDYLASKNLIHCDIKPENILYTTRSKDYRFQLADFRLAQYRSVAKSFASTFYYQAPKFNPNLSKVYVEQSYKSDI